MTIRVVLADDNVLVRAGVQALLDASDGIEVVGVADDAPSLLAKADELEPDVVVTDIKMPPLFQLEGINCAHDIREKHPGTGVVVLSAHDDEAYALALLGGGQSGLAYLLKDRIAQGVEHLTPQDAMEFQEETEATILFSDIRGFSALAEELPAREVATILHRHLAAMAEVVLAHGGTIDKFAGDAVMAVFGVPDEQPDQAERALRGAPAMQDRQTEPNREAWAG